MSSEKEHLRKSGKGTQAVHSGNSPSENSLNTPVYQSSTFFLDDNAYQMWQAGTPRAPVYSRYNNPSMRAAEKKVADLENAEDALVFSSGMAAICTTLLTFLSQGDRIVTTRNLYGGTILSLDQDFTRFGIDVHYVDVKDLNAVEEALKEKETPTSSTNHEREDSENKALKMENKVQKRENKRLEKIQRNLKVLVALNQTDIKLMELRRDLIISEIAMAENIEDLKSMKEKYKDLIEKEEKDSETEN